MSRSAFPFLPCSQSTSFAFKVAAFKLDQTGSKLINMYSAHRYLVSHNFASTVVDLCCQFFETTCDGHLQRLLYSKHGCGFHEWWKELVGTLMVPRNFECRLRSVGGFMTWIDMQALFWVICVEKYSFDRKQTRSNCSNSRSSSL